VTSPAFSRPPELASTDTWLGAARRPGRAKRAGDLHAALTCVSASGARSPGEARYVDDWKCEQSTRPMLASPVARVSGAAQEIKSRLDCRQDDPVGSHRSRRAIPTRPNILLYPERLVRIVDDPAMIFSRGSPIDIRGWRTHITSGHPGISPILSTMSLKVLAQGHPQSFTSGIHRIPFPKWG
jgi:hypothetical protein